MSLKRNPLKAVPQIRMHLEQQDGLFWRCRGSQKSLTHPIEPDNPCTATRNLPIFIGFPFYIFFSLITAVTVEGIPLSEHVDKLESVFEGT
ncbi:hypothetical protein SKAU_G00360270 [Synaphobranchus kaupii]|uniref:Uncharacterized protein n=1 Tax=Synaphobranchus kaupii TaxID=118154 RepID=A0A9Q1IH13_SYNKA|nr:hypothetical protein SKAU_G00360270 [Synaphobranchus kaupii]